MTRACIAHAWMWVSLCTINNVQCVWMQSIYLAEGKVTLSCNWKAKHGMYDELEISSSPVCNRNLRSP